MSMKTERLRAYHARLDRMNDINNADNTDYEWTVAQIKKHFYRVNPTQPEKGSQVMFKVKYKSGETQYVSMDVLRTHDPWVALVYAAKYNLRDKPGWEWIDKYEKTDDEFGQMTRILLSKKANTKIKFGVEVPRSGTGKHALELDRRNGNTLWADSITREKNAMKDYDVFHVWPDDKPLPEGYKKIPYHFVFDVKFDGRRKSRLVCQGNHTDPLKEDVFSGVVSMEAVRLGFMLAQMNDLKVCAGDIGEAFLNAYTREKIYFVAGPEFGPEWAGKRLVLNKSMYGSKSSSARFHEHLSVRLLRLGFRPSKADYDLWMRKHPDGHYEYVARYVDDVIAFAKNPMEIMDKLSQDYTMKGVGKPQYYLGGNVEELSDEWKKQGITTGFSARTYIENAIPRLAKMLDKERFHKASTPFDTNYYPELDDSPILDAAGITKYRSVMGSLNWTLTLGRFDIAYAFGSLSRYMMVPRQGHLKAAERVLGYLAHRPKGAILIDSSVPPVRDIASINKGHSWAEFYPDAVENVPEDLPEPQGPLMTMTCYVDADHARDPVTRRSVTGILLLLNNTPIAWMSRRQRTVETSTYGSELVAARMAVDLIIEMRYKLRILGVPIEDKSVLLGDNMSVVINTTIPSSMLKKKTHACNYHRVREAVSCFIDFGHIDSKVNAADLMTKPLERAIFQPLVEMYLFRTPLTETKPLSS